MTTIMTQNFPQPASAAIASYNYSEIAAGAGYANFYGGGYDNNALSGAAVKMLHSSTFEPGDFPDLAGNPTKNPRATRVVSNDAILGDPYTVFQTSNFNSPRILNGYGLVSFTWALSGKSGGTDKWYFNVDFYKNTTLLGSQRTSLKQSDGTTTLTYQSEMVRILLSGGIKIGDYLKAVLTPVTTSATASNSVYLLHDPMNRTNAGLTGHDAAINPSYLKIEVPFVIDL